MLGSAPQKVDNTRQKNIYDRLCWIITVSSHVITAQSSDWLRRANSGLWLAESSNLLPARDNQEHNGILWIHQTSISDEDPAFKQFLMEFKSIEIQNVWPTGKNGFRITRHQADTSETPDSPAITEKPLWRHCQDTTIKQSFISSRPVTGPFSDSLRIKSF